MKSALHRAYELHDALLQDRRYLHQNPELSHELPLTVAYVKKRLREMGYSPEDVGGGVVAVAGGKKPGKTVLLRADMDALPVTEESGLPFASVNGNAHACGHDMHSAMLLGAAAMLKERESQLEGRVKLMFQPAEETLTGAAAMIKAGVMKNPDVDVAFAIHVGEKPLGHIGYSRSYLYASSDAFEIFIQGKGCHGAMPHNGVDPINVASHIHLSLQEILAREIDAMDTVVLTIGQMTAGHAMNVIPDTALMKGSLRAFSPESRARSLRRLKEIAENIGAAFNAPTTVTITAGIPSMRCDEKTVDFTLRLLQEGDIPHAHFFERKTMGSEDFACVAEHVPVVMLALGAAAKDQSKRYNFHNPKIVFDEDCMPIGTAAHVAFAQRWLAANK